MKYRIPIVTVVSTLIFSALDMSGAEKVDTTRVLNEVVVTGTPEIAAIYSFSC